MGRRYIHKHSETKSGSRAADKSSMNCGLKLEILFLHQFTYSFVFSYVLRRVQTAFHRSFGGYVNEIIIIWASRIFDVLCCLLPPRPAASPCAASCSFAWPKTEHGRYSSICESEDRRSAEFFDIRHLRFYIGSSSIFGAERSKKPLSSIFGVERSNNPRHLRS